MASNCGYKYYNQQAINSNPESKKTDQFIRNLLCNQQSIQQLYSALYLSRQLVCQGLYYCYRYTSLKTLFGPNQTPETKVYQSTRIFLFFMIASKMNDNPAFNTLVLTTRKVEVLNPISHELETIDLDDLDIEVLQLLKQEKVFGQLFLQGRFAFHYVSENKWYCYTAKLENFAGEKLKTLIYNGRALKELFMTYSTDFSQTETSPAGAKCLLERCS